MATSGACAAGNACAVRPEHGQAAVESALVMPLALFIILGLLQMGMMEQGRLFADYAAYRGARAASLGMASCDAVKRAEIAALTPMLGRADDAANWIQTFNTFKDQQPTDRPVVISFLSFSQARPAAVSIDQPVTSEAEVEHIHLQLYFLYELKIPFANWILSQVYRAQYDASALTPRIDTNTVRASAPDHDRVRRVASEATAVVNAMRSYGGNGQYVVPLYASWSMRMFSRAEDATSVTHCQ